MLSNISVVVIFERRKIKGKVFSSYFSVLFELSVMRLYYLCKLKKNHSA